MNAQRLLKYDLKPLFLARLPRWLCFCLWVLLWCLAFEVWNLKGDGNYLPIKRKLFGFVFENFVTLGYMPATTCLENLSRILTWTDVVNPITGMAYLVFWGPWVACTVAIQIAFLVSRRWLFFVLLTPVVLLSEYSMKMGSIW